MANTMTRPLPANQAGNQMQGRPQNLTAAGGPGHDRPGDPKHAEGPVARAIEHYTSQLPSDVFLWAAGGAIATSLCLRLSGAKHDALFVGQWAPTFLLLGIYNKIVKVAGSDRVHVS
jgi:hypothetical protein